ncbi:MAG: glycosyltransferase family 2 protein [Candidatus Omnitrophota bacterium]
MARERLSVVIIAKNEEGRIAKCLDSLKWVDEVVVVDGMSTDRTSEICEKYGAKVIRHEFEGDFGLERNIGNDNCTGDWILQLDADEIVPEEFRERLMKMLSGNDEHAAYGFVRKNIFLGRFMRYGGWYHHSYHLFRRGRAHYAGKVHHQLIVDGKTGKMDVGVEHYPFDDLSQLISRQNRYTSLEAKELYDLRGRIDEKEVKYNIKVKPAKLFWKFYIKKKGFKEGMHGFIFSVLFAWVHFLKWAKYWDMVRELDNKKKPETSCQ